MSTVPHPDEIRLSAKEAKANLRCNLRLLHRCGFKPTNKYSDFDFVLEEDGVDAYIRVKVTSAVRWTARTLLFTAYTQGAWAARDKIRKAILL